MDTQAKLGVSESLKRFIAIGDNKRDSDVVYVANELDKDYESFSGLDVLVVGCLEDPFANLLSEFGARVDGVDYREKQSGDISNGFETDSYNHIVGDFSTLNLNKKYDLVISVSAIEHSGLGYYQESINYDADINTVHNIYCHLKDRGRFYVTVPVGGIWNQTPHWRRYTLPTLTRISSPFREIKRVYFNTSYRGSDIVSEQEVLGYKESADISVLLTLEKFSNE